MRELFLIYKIFSFSIVIASLWLAVWVYFAGRKEKINQLFSLMAISIALWIFFYYLVIISSTPKSALFWSRLAYGTVSIFYLPFYFFHVYFLHLERKLRFLNKVILFGGIVLFGISIFTDWIVKDAVFKDGKVDLVFNKGSIGFYGMAVFLSVLIIILLFKNYFKFTHQERLKIQYFLIGLFIWIFMNFIFNMVFPLWRDSVQYAEFGNYSAIFLLAFTAYAIVKRELFGIKVVLTTLFVGLIAILLVLDLFVFTEKFWLEIFKGFILIIFLIFSHYLIKSVQEEVKRREELEKLDKAKSEFISMASHQLRTPLTAIKGYISLLLEGSYGQVSERARESLKKVFQSNERLIKIVNDLLDLSKIEVGKMELVKEPVQIEDLIQSCYDEMKEAVEKKGLKFIFQKPKELLPKLNIDPLKIREVLLNLIDNASRYTQQGEIKIEVQKKNSKVLISIKDSGEGLSKEEKEKIFEGFTRGSAGINLFIEGRGLGLYVAKKFLELHQAKIWAESPGKGQGSTFFVELPIK